MFESDLKAQVPEFALPVIVLPANKALEGIHNHAGDTFREMVTIWEERGYCKVDRREDTPYVWWGKIGETLLYDRPTMKWFQNPSYKSAFFANCFPEKPSQNDHSWSFWGRSPRAIETIVSSASVLNSYSQRTIPSIFLGKIENGIQKQRRTTQKWSSVIHTFSMPIDSTGGAYKYSQEEYLTLLTKSRFGLCLPGFGPKCNREIEYFATGTVPIITPGVDMKHYKSQPVKGIHYFEASTPEEVLSIVSTITEAQWTIMSLAGRNWWKRYASAEGLFRLTWGLVNKTKNI